MSRGSGRPALERCLESRAAGLTRGLRSDQRAFLRNRAFDLARAALDDGAETQQLLGWLQQVNQGLAAAPGGKAPYACFSPGDDCRRALMELLEEARHTVDICVFTISDDRLSRSIVETHRQGVAVRVITDNDKQCDCGSDIAALEQAGVPTAMDRNDARTHQQFALFDGRTLANGGFNGTRSASKYNRKNITVSSEPDLVERFVPPFASLWRHWR